MHAGTKVRTLYQHSETGQIVKPRKGETPPSADWFVVKFDCDAAKMFIHRDMLAVRNEAA